MPTLQYRIAIVGNPVEPHSESYESELIALRAMGFNCVQLNIAWGTRPGDEALNLEDVVALDHQSDTERVQQRRTELKQRSASAKRVGLRTLFHFGAPRSEGLYLAFAKGLEKEQAVEACLLRPQVLEHYRALVTAIAIELPDVDDLLLYTYDQEAWLCSEFGNCQRCAGIPLHERLPPFLSVIRDAWTAQRPDGRVWWEPWELSAGQIFAIIPRLPQQNFGLMLHSNIAEVQTANSVDTWFRNTARMAHAQGIPVIGEIFMSSASEEVQPLQQVIYPRLVYQQIQAVQAITGICGVKEYFGTKPLRNDPNLAMAASVFARPEAPITAHFQTLTKTHGSAADAVIAAWEAAADGMERFPWDVCWKIRQVGAGTDVIFHPWDGFWIHGHLVDSPSWCSTRRTVFMTTENDSLHPWFIEDIQLRWSEAAKCFGIALDHYQVAQSLCSAELKRDIAHWVHDIALLKSIATAYALHAEQTLVAHMARKLASVGRPTAALFCRLEKLLELDAANQQSRGTPPPNYVTAREMLNQFHSDPAHWVKTHLQMPAASNW